MRNNMITNNKFKDMQDVIKSKIEYEQELLSISPDRERKI